MTESPRQGDDLAPQFEAVALDYQQTVSVIESVLRTRLAMRTLGVTAYVALLAAAIQQTSRALAISGGALLIALWLQDAYLGWAYSRCLARANEIERLVRKRMRALERPYDPFPTELVRRDLRDYDFGVYSAFPSATFGKVRKEIRRSQAVVGAALLIVATLAAILVR